MRVLTASSPFQALTTDISDSVLLCAHPKDDSPPVFALGPVHHRPQEQLCLGVLHQVRVGVLKSGSYPDSQTKSILSTQYNKTMKVSPQTQPILCWSSTLLWGVNQQQGALWEDVLTGLQPQVGHLEWVGKRYVSLRIFLKKREVQDGDKNMATDETEVKLALPCSVPKMAKKANEPTKGFLRWRKSRNSSSIWLVSTFQNWISENHPALLLRDSAYALYWRQAE